MNKYHKQAQEYDDELRREIVANIEYLETCIEGVSIDIISENERDMTILKIFSLMFGVDLPSLE